MLHWYKEYTGLSLVGLLEKLSSEKWYWLVKRLSGNDTGLTGGHQSGLYIPKWFAEDAFPEVCTTVKHNPDIFIEKIFYYNSDKFSSSPSRVIYYNSKYFPQLGLKKKYDEFRITRFAQSSLQDYDNTGEIVLFAIKRIEGKIYGLVWVTENLEQQEIIEDWLGDEVLPGEAYGKDRFKAIFSAKTDKGILDFIDKKWLKQFPTGEDIFSIAERKMPFNGWNGTNDSLLLERRRLEYKLFEEIERQHILPLIGKGFNKVEGFLDVALSIANRRKSRSGRSLELNLASIFRSNDLYFDQNKSTENNKKPDFIFPSIKSYRDSTYPDNRLAMLAAKTTCKDRWRQVLNEANRVKVKHLFTLQEGVSENQFSEMQSERLTLVVPENNKAKFPPSVRAHLLNLDMFIGYVKSLQT